MKKIVRYIGLDVHKETVTIAVADSGRSQAEVVETIGNDLHSLLQVLDHLGPMHKLRVCYEAGPTGFDLARHLTERGIHCVVVAPSLVPTQQGRRVRWSARSIALSGRPPPRARPSSPLRCSREHLLSFSLAGVGHVGGHILSRSILRFSTELRRPFWRLNASRPRRTRCDSCNTL